MPISSGMNVPLSVGPECYDKDHAGIICLVYDIIVNPKVVQDSAVDETGQYRDFLCHLSIQSVEQKYPKNGLLDKQYKLPKLAYMGALVRSQHIRDKSTIPGIIDISENITNEIRVAKLIQKSVEKKDLAFNLFWIKKKNCRNKFAMNNDNDACSSLETDKDIFSLNHSKYEFEYKDEYEYEEPFKDSNNKLYGLSYIEPTMIPDSDVLRITLKICFTENIDIENLEVKVSPYKFQVHTYVHTPYITRHVMLFLPTVFL